MTADVILLAQLESLNPLDGTAPIGKTSGWWLRDGLVILAVGLVLTGLLVFWARYYVQHRKHRRHEHRSQPTGSASEAPSAEREAGHQPRHHRHHRHHHHHRRRRRQHPQYGRNPTLAETGGLPPPRSEPPPGLSA